MEQEQIAFFRSALKVARASFDKKTGELEGAESLVYWLKDDLEKLKMTITALAKVCSEEPWNDSLGITESCMEAMETERRQVSTQDVVKKLEAMGFDFSGQKSPSASVHSVLTRLAVKKKIEKIVEEGSNAIFWRGPKYADDFAQQAEISDDDIPF